MSSAGAVSAAVIEELANTFDAPLLEEIIAEHPEAVDRAAVVRLTEIARERVRVSAAQSLNLANAALAIAGNIDDGACRARALRAQANALWFLNRNQEAVESYDAAVALFEESADETEVGRTLSSSIQPLIRLGEYDRALHGADRARDIFRKSNDRLRLARLDLNVANVVHRQDRFAEAFEQYERAYRQLLELGDAEGIAVALHNMSVCLIVLNDFTRALATHSAATEFFRTHGMPALVAQADYNIAYLYYFRGDYSRALELLRDARVAAERSGDAYHTALCYMDESEMFIELNMNEEAGEAAQIAFSSFQTLSAGYEAAKSLANLAVVEGRIGKPERSLELFQRARELFVKEGNPVWPSLVDLYRGMVLYESGRLAEAAALCDKVVGFFREQDMPTKEILCELLAGRIAADTGDLAKARAQGNTALARLSDVEAPHLEWQVHLLLGRIMESEGEFDAAGAQYEQARVAAESLRVILRGEELKIAFMQGKSEIYEGLVRRALHPPSGPPRMEQAFACMEHAKARSLQEWLMAGDAGAPRSKAPESAAGAEFQQLRRELNWFYHRIEREEASEDLPSAARLAELRAQSRQLEIKLARLLRDTPPEEANRGGVPAPQLLTVDEIRSALDEDTAVVEYFRAGDELVAAVLTRCDLQVVAAGNFSRCRELRRLLQFQFSKFRLGEEYVSQFAGPLLEATREHLMGLYEELFAPLEILVDKKKLVFVPHELLHAIPLHALFDGEQYLADRFSISYAPSSSVYALLAAGDDRRFENGNRSLVLGVPDTRAPFIRDEAESLASLLPGAELYLDERASRRVLEERGGQCRLLHMATHGYFRKDHPMFSAIRLGDGFLTLYDLYGMSLPVELAVLSGCGTALSVVASGDEQIGLVRGLLHAGARRLVLSLWDVQDRTTADFMKSFYARYVPKPDQAADAMRDAMREVRESHPHPYYWAPFVLIGKG